MNWEFLKFWKETPHKPNILEFNDILDSEGNYGILRCNLKEASYDRSEYLIEFKEMNRAVQKNGSTLIKIKILKIERCSQTRDRSLLNYAYEGIKNKTWFDCNESSIWWFSDNQSRRRDANLTELIESK